MVQHHAASQQHGGGVSNVPVGNALPSVPCALEDQERERKIVHIDSTNIPNRF